MPTYWIRLSPQTPTCPWQVWQGTTLLAAFGNCEQAVEYARAKRDQGSAATREP
jgi:hypothetical protein